MDIIEEVQDRLGDPPRKFPLWTRLSYLNFAMPGWARNDPIEHCHTAAPELLKHGSAVWGYTVMANENLFSTGRGNAPGAVVYGPDAKQSAALADLEDIAQAVYGLKNTEPADAQTRLIADHLTDEFSRPFGLPVPASMAGSCACFLTTTFFVRQHLPDRKLSLSFYPLLVSDEYPGMTMVVPSRFWPEEFVNHWIEAGQS